MSGTASTTSTTTGALVVSGGVGVGGGMYVGGAITATTINVTGSSGNITGVNNITGVGTFTAGSFTATSGIATNSITTYPVGSNANLLIDPDGNGDVIFSTLTQVFIYDTATTVSTTTGALVVTGGVGIGGNLAIGGGLYAGGSTGTNGQYLQSTGGGIQWVTLSSTFSGGAVANSTQFNNTTSSTSTTTGAVTIAGGLGVGGSIYAGNIYSNGSLVTGSGGGGSVAVQYGGSVLTSAATVLNFSTGTTATVSGSAVTIWATASGGGTTTATDPVSNPSISSGVLTIDTSAATAFNVTVGSSITSINITNAASSSLVTRFVLVFNYTAAVSVVWPASFRWANGVAPTLTNVNGKRDIFTIFTTDGGTSYNAIITGQNF